MNQYADSSYLCFCVSCVNVIVEDAVRTVKVRRRSHRKCASIKLPRNFLKKKAANDLLQWPTSPKWHIFAHHLLDCSIAPPCADLGLCCDRSKPPRGRDVEQSSPRPDWIQNRRRILVDDLRSFRRRRSKQDATLASSGVKIPVNVKMSASMGSSIIQSRSWHEYSGSNEPEQWLWPTLET